LIAAHFVTDHRRIARDARQNSGRLARPFGKHAQGEAENGV
jgi:hypothetical protein